MRKSKLLVLFLTLNSKERLALRKFIKSPFWNKRDDILDLYAYMEAESRKKAPVWGKEQVYQSLYPNQSYDEIQMRHLMSILFRLTESFLANYDADHQDIQQKINLARIYRKRQLYKFFEQTVKAAEAILDKMPKDSQFFHYKYLLELEVYQFLKNQKRVAVYNLQELTDAVDIRFLTDKLKQSCLLLSHQAVFNIDYDPGLLPSILTLLPESNYLKIPAISIYYYCYLALTEDKEEYFAQFKQQIMQEQAHFSTDEFRDLYLLAINFCIKKLNTGQEKYVGEAFELYKSGIESEVLLEKKRLSRFAYKNIVALGLRMEAYDWISYFLDNFTKYLERRFRDNYYNYNFARLSYSKHNYKAAMESLSKVGTNDVLLNIDAKVLQLKMYYELDEFDTLDSLIASMGAFVRRKNMLTYHRENYRNILKYFQKLSGLNYLDKQAIADLRSEIDATSVLTEKKWLLEQLS